MKRKSTFAVILLGMLLLFLTACSAEDVAFIQGMAEEWARAKNSHPINSDGSINIEGGFNALKNVAGVSGSDPDVTAVLDAKNAVESIKKADDAAANAQQALKGGDPKKAVNILDAAVKDRPNDWWLVNQRGVDNIEAGNADAGDQDLSNAGNLTMAQSISTRVEAVMQQENLLRDSIARQKQIGVMPRCATYRALATTYSRLQEYRGYQMFQANDSSYYGSLSQQNDLAASQPGVTCRQ